MTPNRFYGTYKIAMFDNWCVIIIIVIVVQIVGALAIMMDMKKGVVNETVKENRADELSAMFNMMIDNRKRIMGK